MSKIRLVLGGARSGKSRFAERLALHHAGPRTYIATAEPIDDEMAARIARHREDRKTDGWTTLEVSLDPGPAIAAADGLVLVDCVTVWLGNLMHYQRDMAASLDELYAALAATHAEVILVSNEVGLSIVPENAMARRFRDVQGQVNQRLAALAQEVYLLVAGIPMKIK